jgi:hypothetical protein
MEAVKPGMTRQQLLIVFREEGGLSTRTQRRYAFRECPYIKIDATFEPVGPFSSNFNESPNDRISKLSKPFLEHPIVD